MEKQYNPAIVEEKIYTRWIKEGCFHADENTTKQTYSIVIPPPNVTGVLHMGHALNNTVQDILVRYKRMNGYEAMWMPGTDHAGIATQNVVEKKLAKQGKSRYDLGRKAFVEEVWKWKEEYHATITNQLKKLGSSCDWDRERFTMDQGLSHAVRKVFVDLYNDGLIYRGKYIINWCPRCRTALSDEEAEHKEKEGKLWYFKYPFEDGSGFVTVATTRPETMLGDTAVAVNPSDGRYATLVGKNLILPLANRIIPMIADPLVDKEFGTGAVKVTPAHDPNDFIMGQRHTMQPIVVMDEGAVMAGDIPEKYKGLDRFVCRKLIVEDMEALGLVEKIEKHTHAIGHCYRCDTIVEPYYSDQWFVKMKPLAQKALKAAMDNELTFFPARWRKTYIEWMENIRDWCISRQIWWGHRIPVWYCDQCGRRIAAETDPAECPLCKSKNLRQDQDVLDTWFSSWLWPFSTMGWPEKTKTLETFYPTNALVTAPEILFFWVARMLMAGLYCTGKLPFTDIVLHGTVRDKSGKKMSKSLGNVIDPLEIIANYGTDALRFSIVMITAQGADVFLSKDTFDIGRNFANKLWNASRFLLGNIEKPLHFDTLPSREVLKAEDRWIISRFNGTITRMREAIETYRFNEASHLVYDFTWHDFCDWYVEAKKGDLYQETDPDARRNALNICSFLLAGILKLLHPIMPYITEEIWTALGEKVRYPLVLEHATLMMAPYPCAQEKDRDADIEQRFDLLKDCIVALRTIRAENNVPPDKKGAAVLIPGDEATAGWLREQVLLFNLFAKLDTTTIDTQAKKPPFAGQGVVRGIQIFLALEGLIDKQVEIDRLTKETAHLKTMAHLAAKRLENESFIGRAPQEVVAKEREKYRGILESLEKMEKNLAVLLEP
jgi:valyl-tRNA synthetase